MKTNKLLSLFLSLTIIASMLGTLASATDPTYNANDIAKLTAFANQGDNLAQLDWDLSDPSSWDYVTWTIVDDEYRLERFTAYEKNLTGDLDLSDCSALEYLFCRNNKLASLDLSNCVVLEELHCNNNKLTSLNLTNCSKMILIGARINQLTELDVTGMTSLIGLDISRNDINADELTSPGTYVKGINEVPAFIKWNAHGTGTGYFGFTPQNYERTPGDVDKNGRVNSTDAVMILRALFWTHAGFNWLSLDGENADVDGNGKVNATDATLILRHLFWTGDKRPTLL